MVRGVGFEPFLITGLSPHRPPLFGGEQILAFGGMVHYNKLS